MEKVLPPIYQHPYVDVFQKFKLFEASQVTKEGDVTQSIDKKLGKKIYKIQGATSASNYVMTPSKKAKYKSLGLTGRYNYVIMKAQTGKLFSTHLDFIVNGDNLCRVSISNIFKDFKASGSSIQIPVKEMEAQKWTIIQLNIFNILEENGKFNKSAKEKEFYLRSFQICSNQFIRGIITSDIDYNVTNFPKELSLKCKASEDWFKLYGWVSIGKSEEEEPQERKPPKKVPKPKRPKSVLRNTTKDPKMKDTRERSKKRVAFELEKDEPTKDEDLLDDQENIKDIANLHEERKSLKQMHQDHENKDHLAITAELERVRDNSSLFERTKTEIEEIKRQYEIDLHGKPSEADFSVKNNDKFMVQRHPDPHGSADPTDVFLLKPDPIMRLSQCVGSHPKYNSQSILFHKNMRYGNDVLYGSSNMVVSMNTKSMKQKFLFDHPDHVRKIAMTSEFIISASKPGKGNNEKKKKRKFNKLVQDQEIQIIVWDVHTGANIVSFKPPIEEICDMYVSFKNTYLVIVGTDYQGRDIILAYNFPDMVKYNKIDLITRQLSDWNIQAVQNHPINDLMFITGGKESIRFWKIKGSITGTNVIHNKLGRGKEFTQILYDYEVYDDHEDTFARKPTKDKPLGKVYMIYVGTK